MVGELLAEPDCRVEGVHADPAAETGCGDTIKSYETGRAEPSAKVLAALAIELGIGMDELFGRHDDPVMDYVDAVAQHCPPLTPEEVQGAAVVLRAMRQARHSRSEQQVPA